MKHLNITIHGRVQGVGFRYNAQRMAQQLNVKGFVKNQYDNTVYIEAEAEELNLQQFVDWCRQGPVYAHVSKVDMQEAPLFNFTGFSIR